MTEQKKLRCCTEQKCFAEALREAIDKGAHMPDGYWRGYGYVYLVVGVGTLLFLVLGFFGIGKSPDLSKDIVLYVLAPVCLGFSIMAFDLQEGPSFSHRLVKLINSFFKRIFKRS